MKQASATSSSSVDTTSTIVLGNPKPEETILAPSYETTEFVTKEITEAITSSNADLIMAISKLSTDLSTSIQNTGDGATLTTSIFVVITGAFSAYIFNFLHWKVVTQKQNIASYISGLTELTKEIEPIAINYWLLGYTDDSKTEIQISEITMKSSLKLIARQVKFISPKIKCESRKKKLIALNNRLYDLVTGGDFESKRRTPSKNQASKIASTCSEIRVILSELVFHA